MADDPQEAARVALEEAHGRIDPFDGHTHAAIDRAARAIFEAAREQAARIADPVDDSAAAVIRTMPLPSWLPPERER